MGKRVLNEYGKFEPYREKKVATSTKSVTKPEVNSLKPVDGEDTAPDLAPKDKIVLTGDETNPELKAYLDGVKVKYPKTANKDKLLELLAPYTESIEELVEGEDAL